MSSPFGAAAPSGPEPAPGVVGIEPGHMAFPGRQSIPGTGPWRRVSRFHHLRRIEATSSPYLANHVRPQPRILSGVCDYSGRTHCLPRLALPCGLLRPQARGMGLPSYDRRQVLVYRSHTAPRGAHCLRRNGLMDSDTRALLSDYIIRGTICVSCA